VNDSKADIVMMFVDKNGDSVWAESTLDVLKSDPFMKDFEPITDYNDYSNFFEVKSFNFTIKLNPRDEGVGALSQTRNQSQSVHAVADQYSRWRSALNDDYKKIRFPIEFDEFSFTRVIDGASPRFFSACCNQDSFKSAALVKRVPMGTHSSATWQSMGYLRFDFRDVMLTNVDWDDGDLVTESCTFICKAMRVRYRQQDADGRFLDAPLPGAAGGGGLEAVWDQKKDGQSNGSRGA
jgi:type VI protein secretion system component Hcp